MLLVLSQELESQGIEHKTATSFFFQGNLFERGMAFSNRLYGLAIEACQKELAAGGFCLLVDHETHLTVWRQKFPPNQTESDYLETAQGGSPLPFLSRSRQRDPHQTIERNDSKALPTTLEPSQEPQEPDPNSHSTASLIYRGKSYPASSAQPLKLSNPASDQTKSVRKYRGVAY